MAILKNDLLVITTIQGFIIRHYCDSVGKHCGKGFIFLATTDQPDSALVAFKVQDRKPKAKNFQAFVWAGRHFGLFNNYCGDAVVELETAIGTFGWRWGNVMRVLNAEMGLETALIPDVEIFKQPQLSFSLSGR